MAAGAYIAIDKHSAPEKGLTTPPWETGFFLHRYCKRTMNSDAPVHVHMHEQKTRNDGTCHECTKKYGFTYVKKCRSP